jgi:hypothetical protein
MYRWNGAGREEQNHFGSGWRFVFSDVHPSGQSFATFQNSSGKDRWRSDFRMNKSHIFSFSALPNQVSFFSSSPELSNKQRFEYFTRTIPSDHHQVMAIVQMIRFLKWSYISILYEESTYGIKVNTLTNLD